MALEYGEGGGIEVQMDGPYGNASPTAKIGQITIQAAAWKGGTSPYTQVVALDGISINSKVDIQPSAAQLATLCATGVALTTENDGGVLTVVAIGRKPAADMVLQVTITEVTV